MSILIQYEIDWIVAIQSLGSWLTLPMRLFSLFRSEYFFYLVVPFLYWSVDAGLGLRVALLLTVNDYLNSICKLLFAGPRPYWVSARVRPLQAEVSSGNGAGEGSFGIPSGHAQDAAALLGAIASWVNRPWAWAAALALAFCIGLSRIYLGVHFIHDVVAGWVIGYVALWVLLRVGNPLAAWLKTKTLLQQGLLVFAIALVMIASGAWAAARLQSYVLPVAWQTNALRAGHLSDPVSIDSILTAAGSFSGLALGAAWITARGGYQASGSMQRRFIRYLLGMIVTLILWFGLERIVPHGTTWIAMSLRYFRFSLVGFWITAGAPWVFVNLRLADAFNKNMVEPI